MNISNAKNITHSDVREQKQSKNKYPLFMIVVVTSLLYGVTYMLVQNKTITMIKIEDFGNDMMIPDVSIPHLEKTDFINKHSFNTLINAQCDATMQSIKDQGVDVDLITLPRLDENAAGRMIMYYELLTSVAGHFLNVNTYDQPGVELGKVILKEKFEK